jgi:signal transduction histidine kinase
MNRPLEPGLLRVFRYFSRVAMGYFFILWVYALVSAGWASSMQVQAWGNLAVYVALAGYLTWPGLERRLKRWYLPIGLVIATIFPVLSMLTYLLDPGSGDVSVIISRSWLLLPILLVPLVLIAWQYSLGAMIAFTVFANGLELVILLVVVDAINLTTLPLLGVPAIRAFAFGVVGYIIRNLIETQRLQQAKLIEANVRLGQYANTLEDLAVSRERNRLASELHDTLAHTLSGLAVNLEAIKTVLGPQDAAAQEMLDHSLHTTRVGLDETRRALKALRAGPLEEFGLRLALEALAQSAAERAAIPVAFSCPADLPRLPQTVEQSLYRITQEALENVVRHANATHASVQVATPPGGVILTVHDDGLGLDPARAASAEAFGLRGLRERAVAAGGTLMVKGEPGAGTTIRFTWEGHDD